ncbi:SDR family NAD(P)-dependent oxidoreductase [Shinella sp. 838]|uniref:SDR family NAD(P)-dependent oxidoreductase n=1 Tax=Shinella sp. 838 TaxID=3038164 RepID=UPI002414D6DD|nr:SDR family oxidoreductase [Shinella sp. 838]MDG4674925.1 SDR family NAD(P)-dependent oxidoreductase [Shinella sp. 838]
MKTIIITGGNKGLGLAQSALFLERGWSVYAVSRSKGDLDTLPQDNLHWIEANLSDWSDTSWLDAIHANAGRIDGLVNNAGVHLKKPVWDVAADELDGVLDINVKAMFLASGRYIALQKDRGGAIVNISSMGGLMALQSAAAYVTAKTAVVGLTRSIALDAAPMGFRCNAVCPGFIETDMTRAILAKDPARRDRIEARIPSHRFGLPEDVARAIFFLVSDESRYINGVALPVDDGYSIGF